MPWLLLPFTVLPALLARAGLFGDDVWFNVGLAVCFAAAGLSLNVLMGYAGQISLGHFTLIGVGAFMSGWITGVDRLALPFFVAVPAAALTGGAVAVVIGIPALRLRGLYLAVATIGFSYAAQYSVFKVQAISRGSAGVELPRPQLNTFILIRNADYLVVLLVLLILLWLVDRAITGSKLGRAFQAIRADESMAASFGVDVRGYKLLAFVLSGAMAGVAGSMYGHLIQFANSESFSFERSLILVVIVVVGGLGSRVGVLVSAVFYSLYPVYVVKVFGDRMRLTDAVIGAALLMYTVSRHPGGLAEAWGEGAERRKARRLDAARGADGADGDDGADAAMPKLPELPRPSGLPGYSIASALTRIGSAGRVERELRSRATDAIEALGFERYTDQAVKRLSHGQQRIVELGCALVTAPELVLLDEPSAGMSPGAAENLAVRLRDIRDQLGRTVLLIEHNIPLVLDVCDELHVLSGGVMIASGEPDEVVGRAAVIESYLGAGFAPADVVA